MTVRVEEEEFKLACTDCMSILYFTWEDVLYASSTHYYINCPRCEGTVRIAPEMDNAHAIRYIRENRDRVKKE